MSDQFRKAAMNPATTAPTVLIKKPWWRVKKGQFVHWIKTWLWRLRGHE